MAITTTYGGSQLPSQQIEVSKITKGEFQCQTL